MRIIVDWVDLTQHPVVTLEGEWHPRDLRKVPYFIFEAYKKKIKEILIASRTPISEPQVEVKDERRKRQAK